MASRLCAISCSKNFNFLKSTKYSLCRITTRDSSFLSGTNSTYIEELYECWKKDSNSVHKSWDLLFRASENGQSLTSYYQAPPSFAFSDSIPQGFPAQRNVQTPGVNQEELFNRITENLAVHGLIRSYQNFGHRFASINPLEIADNSGFDKSDKNEISLAYWGLTDAHLSKVFHLPKTTFIGGGKTEMTLGEIVNSLQKIYTRSIGIEYSHLEDNQRVEWLKKRMEDPQAVFVPNEEKKTLLNRVIRATMFEIFLSKKYPSEKRFGLEGCEVLISSLQDIIDQSVSVGVESFILGMAHRGRLNVLANVCSQPLEHIFCRFNDQLKMGDECSSDVKYHLGLSRANCSEKHCKEYNVALVANPSHLEAVNPVVKGKARAEQFLQGDYEGNKVMTILVHGDAAFSGQGVVFETFHLSELPNYTVHGTVHVVTNNQIGFTTDPRFSRSSRYCTDVAKVVNAPIFHVNGDDPEAVSFVSKIASEYRNKFKKDVVIDLVSYRRNGHNEGDNPSFTQPLMYDIISKKPNVMEIYSKELIDSGILTSEEYKTYLSTYENELNKDFVCSQEIEEVENRIWIDSPWRGFFSDTIDFKRKPTGVSKEVLAEYQKLCCKFPESFNLNVGLKRVMNQRMEMLETNKLDWAMGEIAAFSSLLNEGIHVRLSGQDVERGTFSHRHHVLHDSKLDKVRYVPLNNLSSTQAKYMVCNSSLSEYAVLGFEIGYSTTSPNILSIWEAQFGDFANTAQCAIDQFISSGQDKWVRQSGLVLLLPHGFDGMGPEHSSARLERFLQLSKEDSDLIPKYEKDNFEVEQIYNNNWIVANLTTPANLFHALRRQLSFGFRKPLVIMSPKNLLRHELARSSLDEMDTGTHFRRLIEENGPASMDPLGVKRLIFCSGKVYYELFKLRAELGREKDFAICRIEQISPFPFDLVSQEMNKYKNAEFTFTQEEPKNQGSWTYVYPRLLLCCDYNKGIKYAGRDCSASPATGSKSQHNIEQKSLLDDSFA